MDDDKLFGMVEECVAFAVNRLENAQILYPFAMFLDKDEEIKSLLHEEDDHENVYEVLLEKLKLKAEKEEVEAIALLARVTIPSNFSPAVSEGIRIHIEERKHAGKKIGARYLYIPYELYKATEIDAKISVKLHPPIPVAFPQEVLH